VRINAVVQVNTAVAAGVVVPIGWAIQKTMKFGATVYGTGPATTMRDMMASQSELYGQHRTDHVVG
jgi:hypothetical protein